MSDYGLLEEFVFMVTEIVPQLLSIRQRAELILGLRARVSRNLKCVFFKTLINNSISIFVNVNIIEPSELPLYLLVSVTITQHLILNSYNVKRHFSVCSCTD